MVNMIYVVLESSIYYGEDTHSVTCFESMEAAQQYFDARISEIKTTEALAQEEDLIIEKSEQSFSMYVDGCYTDDHIELTILETWAHKRNYLNSEEVTK